MTVSVRTQCPRCHTTYPMPESKLGNDRARATCGKCQHTFFINEHLVSAESKNTAMPAAQPVKATTSATPKPAAAPKQDLPKQGDLAVDVPTSSAALAAAGTMAAVQRTDKPIQDILASPVDEFDAVAIHDHMVTEHDEEDEDVDFDLSQLESLMQANLNRTEAVSESKSSVEENEVKGGNQEDAWLEDLLKNNAAIPATPMVKTIPNSDMSDLLGADIDSIIPVSDPISNQNPKELNKKIQARLKSSHPTQEQLMQRRSLGSQVMWGIGCVLLLVSLAAQYVFFNLDSLIKNPSHAQTLRSLCDVLTCKLPSAEPAAFAISPEIREGMGDRANVFAVLQNTSNDDQLLPNLKVTLMGESGVVGEFVAQPNDYLLTPQRLLAGGQRKSFLLTADAPAADVTSARIEPFY